MLYRSDLMNIDKHIDKAKRLQSSIEKLNIESDWEAVVEIAYGISLNYVAIICELLLDEHQDTHKGLAKFLDKNDLSDLATMFRELDILRQGRWYGGKHNGETAKRAINIIRTIKEKMDELF